jgi:hypothetical protein
MPSQLLAPVDDAFGPLMDQLIDFTIDDIRGLPHYACMQLACQRAPLQQVTGCFRQSS